MASLYEISGVYAALLDAYDAAQDDDEREAIVAQIITVDNDMSIKADNYAKIIKSKEAESKAYHDEAERLDKKSKSAENVAKRLKQVMFDAMKLTNTTSIPTSIGKWYTQNNPWSAEVIDANKVPAEYHVPQPDKIDRQALLKRFKETGEIVDGVEFKQELGVRFR